MNPPTNVGALPDTAWNSVQQMASRFERAAQAGAVADWEPFLPHRGNALRLLALNELVKIDLEMRWRRGESVELEDYVRRFPELAAERPLSPRLLYEEYRVRHRHGDRPALELYGRRFPEQFSELQRLIKESRSLAPPPTTPAAPAATAPAAAPPAQTGLQGGTTYRLLDRLGQGAFGEVWRAEAPGGFPAAVKIIIKSLDQEEARRELKALNVVLNLRHPYLLRNEAAWVDNGRLHIAMELADGSLRERHNACRAAGMPGIPLPELLRYFREAAEALDYLHTQNVLHRDVKPENLLLLAGHAKVADFGLARVLGQDGAVEIDATFVGTLAYMPPETWRNKVSAHSDQYSLAYTYAELRLGRRPFQSTNMAEAMMDHLQRAPDLTGLCDAERDVLLKALAKEPGDRYPTCLAFVEALEAALKPPDPPAPRKGDTGESIVVAPGPGWRPPRPAPGSRLRLVLLVATVVFAWGVALAVYLKKPSAPPPPPPPPSLSLKLHETALLLTPRKSATVVVRLTRENLTDEVKIRVDHLPTCVNAGEAALSEDGQTAQIKLTADDKVTPGTWDDVTVRAEAAGLHEEARLSLTVCFLPPDCEPLPGELGGELGHDDDGKPYFKVIERKWPGGGPPVRFLLVQKTHKDDPVTFYMMENKVSVGQFRAFAETHKDDVKDVGLEQDAPADYPVGGVGVEDAYRFARWLGGNLPSAAQWDKASGAFDADEQDPRPAGPYQGTWDPKKPLDIWVNHKEGPTAVGKAKDDRSKPFGCLDMAGNGVEWTRTFYDDPIKKLPLPPPVRDAFLVERGRSYDAKKPWQYADRSQNAGIEDYSLTAKDLGFRVVIEP